MNNKSDTPLIEQYKIVKNQYKDHVLLFQVGDFFEMFLDDAVINSNILGLTLTQKNNVPMCGIPLVSKDIYINRLVKLNKKVALCEQVGADHNQKIIKREVTKVFTPGTTINMYKDYCYLMAIVPQNKGFLINYVDLSAREGYAVEVTSSHLLEKVLQINPTEIIVPENMDISPIKNYENIIEIVKIVEHDPFNLIKFYLSINKQENIDSLIIKPEQEHLQLCSNSLSNLNLVEEENSLLCTLDFTQTNMGYRYLKQALLHPFLNKKYILQRQNLINYFINLYRSKPFMKIKVNDLRKMISNIKDVNSLKNIALNIDRALEVLYSIGDVFITVKEQLKNIVVNSIIHDNIDDDCNYTSNHIKQLIKQKDQLYERMCKHFSVGKIKRNNLIGFFVELKKTQKPQEDFLLKQSMINVNRYTSAIIMEIENEIVNLEHEINIAEKENFNWLYEQVVADSANMELLCDTIAKIDFFYSCAQCAVKYDYNLPQFNDHKKHMEIIQAKHPIIEQKMHFVDNDLKMNHEKYMAIITGPNMGGKSTFLKTNAILVIMAQCGMYVPATYNCSIVNKIFMRIGAKDNLIEGKSTFMMEMLDCTNIMLEADENSMVLIDELGRGTSTKDGMSLSIAIIEYLHNVLKPITLIATHYNELSKCAEYLTGLYNLKTSIVNSTLIYKITEGVASGSFGILVAKDAQLPNCIIERAKEIENNIEVNVKLK